MAEESEGRKVKPKTKVLGQSLWWETELRSKKNKQTCALEPRKEAETEAHDSSVRQMSIGLPYV